MGGAGVGTLMALAVGQPFAGYEIVAELGRGGMGAVYQARQLPLQRLVALKILRPQLASDKDFIARFQSEAIAAAHLNHPNIVHVYAAGECDGVEYIAMEYVEGETIQHRLRRCGRLPLTEALDIAYHIAAALDYAWQRGQIIHRDVKPDNIFLAQNGTVKLGDFGLAKILRDGAASQTITGHIMGSPHFISPEQARGQRDVDFRADIYSLGCTLHCMMTGRTVFEGPDFVSIMYKHVNERPAPIHTLLPNCPASLNRLLNRMLAKEREQRHQGYAELIDEILAVRNDAAIWESSDERQRQRMSVDAPRTGLRRKYVFALLAALAVVAGISYGRRLDSGTGSVVTLADPSDRRDFIEAVQKLPPLERIERVMAKLQEVNPAFVRSERFAVENQIVTELSFSSVGVKNLWPLCALKHLRVLHCIGNVTNRHHGDLSDLSPLRELPELQELDCSWTNVEDLQPLSQLPLAILRCADTRVRDLSPLQSLPLVELDVSGTGVPEVTALKGKPLHSLWLDHTRARDLSPLRDAPIKDFWCDDRLRREQAEVIRSWRDLESINGSPPLREFNRRLPGTR